MYSVIVLIVLLIIFAICEGSIGDPLNDDRGQEDLPSPFPSPSSISPSPSPSSSSFPLLPISHIIADSSINSSRGERGSGSDVGGECGLRCWISKIVIDIPPISTTDHVLYIVNVSNLVCRNFGLDNIQSQFILPSNVSLKAEGVNVSCNGDFAYSVFGLPWEYGTVDCVVQDSDLGFILSFYKDSDGLAEYSTASSCDAHFYIPTLNFNGGGIVGIILERINNTIRDFMQEQLKSITCQEIQNVVYNNLTHALQQIDSEIRPFLKPLPPSVLPPVPQGMTNLSDSFLVAIVRYFLNKVVGVEDVTAGLNTLVDQLTNGTGVINSDRLLPGNETLEVLIPVQGMVNISLSVLEFEIEGLDTWSRFDLFRPSTQNPYLLNSCTVLDRLSIKVLFLLNVTQDGNSEDGTLSEEGLLSILLTNNTLNSTIQVAFKEHNVFQFIQDPLLLLRDPTVLLFPFHHVNLTQLLFNMTVDFINLTAVSGDFEREFDQAIDNVLLLFTEGFGSAIPAFWNGYVASFAMDTANHFFNTSITKAHDSNATYSIVPYDLGIEKEGSIFAVIGGASFFLFVSVILMYQQCVISFKNEKNSETEQSLDSKAEQLTPCLSASSSIPSLARYGIPFLIIANITIFLSSNLSVGASVYMVLSFGGEKVRLPCLFSFSLSNSVRDMWNADVKPLSILIGVFSGGWPYLKLVMMLGAWIIPTSLLKSTHREKMLMFLDAFGKWSLIDAYVMVLMLVAFRFHMAPPELTSYVDVFVDPMWGIYTFIFATMLSLFITHVILWYHRKNEKSEEVPISNEYQTVNDTSEQQLPNLDSPSIPLCRYAFPPSSHSALLPCLGPLLITLLLMAAIVNLSLGVTFPSFSFQFQGAAAMVLEYLHQPVSTNYSLISLGVTIPSSSEEPEGFGIHYIQTAFFLFGMGIPLGHLVLLLMLWLVPLTRADQRRVFTVTEVFNAWSAIDVFVVSLIAALLEIEQFAQFIIGDKCDVINKLLKEYFDKELHGNDKCFSVETKLLSGCWLLFSACVVYLVSAFIVMRACHKALAHHPSSQPINTVNATREESDM